MDYSDLTYQISKMINVPSRFLVFPDVITNLIIPMLLFPYLLKHFFLDGALSGLFPSWTRWGIAVVISFVSILFVSVLAYPISIGSILYFSYNKITDYIKGSKGKILGIIIGIIGVFIYLSIPSLINMLMGSFRPYY